MRVGGRLGVGVGVGAGLGLGLGLGLGSPEPSVGLQLSHGEMPREWHCGEVCREPRVHLVLQCVVHRLGEPRARPLEHFPRV